MSFFGFGKKKQKAPSDQEILGTLGGLQTNLTQLEKRQELLEAKIKNEFEAARVKNKAGNKRAAMQHLKKKKMYEAEVEKLDGAKMNLEQQISAIQGTQTNMQIYNAMDKANNIQQRMNQGININKIDKLKDDMEENQMLQDEVSQALCQPSTNMMDDDDLLDELDELEAQDVEQQMLGMDVGSSLEKPAVPTYITPPSVPMGPVKQEESKNEDAELEAMWAELDVA